MMAAVEFVPSLHPPTQTPVTSTGNARTAKSCEAAQPAARSTSIERMIGSRMIPSATCVGGIVRPRTRATLFLTPEESAGAGYADASHLIAGDREVRPKIAGHPS